MELPTLIVKLLSKLSPASSLENDKIATGCRLWYDKLQKKGQDKKDKEEPLNLVDKAVSFLNEWWAMVILSALYFFILNYAQQLMNPGDDHQDDNLPPR